MSSRSSFHRVVATGLVVVLAYLFLLGEHGLHPPCTSPRWFEDLYDVTLYYARAQFYPRGLIPYRQVFSEYPTVATLAFAVPMVIAPATRTDPSAYVFVWQCLMSACLIGLLALVARFRLERGLSPWPALVLLTPAVLYFSLSRFDVLCTLVACASLVAFARQRYAWAHVLLAISTFVKWYPALLFPIYLSFHRSQEGTGRALWRGTVFAAAVGLFVAATIAVCTWKGFLVPYRFHATRGSQFFNLYWVVEHSGIAWSAEEWRAVGLAFFAAQFAIVPILLVRGISTVADVLRYSVLAIWLFVTFAKIDSPQWILWILPPMLLFVRRASTIAMLTAVGFVAYAVFPFAYDSFRPESTVFQWIILLKSAALFAGLILALRESNAGNEQPDSETPCISRGRS